MKTDKDEKTWKMEVLDNKCRVRSLLGNRALNKNHIKELKRSMKEHGVLSAITVMKTGKTYTVLDGHHRWNAAKSLKYSVPAMVVNSTQAEAVVDLNTVQKNWQLSDFANYYSNSSNKEIRTAYKTIIEYHNKTGLNYSALVYILGKQQPKHFKKGTFRVNRQLFADAFFVYLEEISDYVPFAYMARFALGFVHLASSPLYDHQRMLRQLNKKHNQVMETKGNPGTYGKLMQTIYNHGFGTKSLVIFKNWR